MTSAQRKTILEDITLRLMDIREECTTPADYEDGGRTVDEEGCECDVRLQLHSLDSYAVRFGDSSYDQDHRGYWGASSVNNADTDEDLASTAEDLLEQALDDAAMNDCKWAQDEVSTPSLPPSFIDQDHDGLA
jgi:hypothetical protein